jgi:hypothetical protein
VNFVLEGDSRTGGTGSSLNAYRLDVEQILVANVGTRLPSSMTFQFLGPITSGDPPTDHSLGVGGSLIEQHTNTYIPQYFGHPGDGAGPKYNAQVVVYMIGINNTVDDTTLAAGEAAYLPGLLDIYNRMSSQCYNFRLVVCYNFFANGRSPQQDELNDFFTAQWASFSVGRRVTICDPRGLAVFPGDYQDGIHLNDAGNAKIAPVIAEAIMVAMGY